MSVLDATMAMPLLDLLEARRSARRIGPGAFPPALIAELTGVVRRIPSAFDTQPWIVVVLQERNEPFWDLVEETIIERLEGERRARYLARAAGMRDGGMTLLVFEELARSGPRDNLSFAEARDHAAQSLGMLQLGLWLTITAHGFVTSLQHWQFLLEDITLAFAGLPGEGYRLVAMMPVGSPVESAPAKAAGEARIAFERVAAAD